jgi:hypothetical protein
MTNVDPKAAVHSYAVVFSSVKEEVQGLNLSEPSVLALLDQQSPEAEFAELEKSGERDPERLALPYVRAVSRLRDELRSIVLSASLETKTKQAIFRLSDRIRDYDLADLGVQLDDQPGKPSLLKFVPVAKLIAAREEKAASAAEKANQKMEGIFPPISRISISWTPAESMAASHLIYSDPSIRLLIRELLTLRPKQRRRRKRRPRRKSGEELSSLRKKCSRGISSTRSGMLMEYRSRRWMAANCPRASSKS